MVQGTLRISAVGANDGGYVMARIRSIHPGQTKDSDFVELSFPARLLAIFIRNWCDDQGVFEWKPKQLKMEIFPADNIEIDPLLSELIAHKQVMSYELDGRHYGAVRNFGDWQRPKKPNRVYPVTQEVRKWTAGKGGVSTELDVDDDCQVPNRFRTGTEFTPQRKEEGDKMEEGGRRASTREPPRKKTRLDNMLETLISDEKQGVTNVQ
jgi:hypothetical protein